MSDISSVNEKQLENVSTASDIPTQMTTTLNNNTTETTTPTTTLQSIENNSNSNNNDNNNNNSDDKQDDGDGNHSNNNNNNNNNNNDGSNGNGNGNDNDNNNNNNDDEEYKKSSSKKRKHWQEKKENKEKEKYIGGGGGSGGSGSNFKTGVVKITESTQARRQEIIDLSTGTRTPAEIPEAPKYDSESLRQRSIGVIERVDRDLLKSEKDKEIYMKLVQDLVQFHFTTAQEWNSQGLKVLCKKHKLNFFPKKPAIRTTYIWMRLNGLLPEKNVELEKFLITKAMRSQSGVLVVTVWTSPYPRVGDKIQRFSCKHNCHYCPNEPNMPRSYLSEESGVRRGHQHNWDPIEQFYARTWAYHVNGHPIDKVELLVLGGTWSEYPHEYQEMFLRDIFYSANTFFEPNKREPLSLEEEQTINESAQCKIIGVTLETRPDTIEPDELRRMRRYGCTRVQIGIQHTNDKILKLINRGCENKDAINCVRLLKNSGFKIDFHLMPDLPGTTIRLDKQMFNYVLHSTEMQADQWKLYPCQIVPWTMIKKWYDEGKYTPFDIKDLIELMIHVKSQVHPWIRLNRVVRDIPNQYIIGGNEITNLRQYLEYEMNKKRGIFCRCIRCREVKAKTTPTSEAKLFIRKYESSGGDEYFLSFETEDETTIFGFVRLRLVHDKSVTDEVFPELKDCAMIRELHVYGQMKPVSKEEKIQTQDYKTQHAGFGRRLMEAAQAIAVLHGFTRLSVIAGIGTRNYYRKLGYRLIGTYLIKDLATTDIAQIQSDYMLSEIPYENKFEPETVKLHNKKIEEEIEQLRDDEFEPYHLKAYKYELILTKSTSTECSCEHKTEKEENDDDNNSTTTSKPMESSGLEIHLWLAIFIFTILTSAALWWWTQK